MINLFSFSIKNNLLFIIVNIYNFIRIKTNKVVFKIFQTVF